MAVTIVAAMAVEQMKQRAGEDQHEGQVLHDVRAMLGDKEVAAYQGESKEYPAA